MSARGVGMAIDARLRQQALEYLVLVWSREADESELRELAVWRASDERHEHAWQHVCRLDQRLAALPAQASVTALRAASKGMSRRSALRALGSLAIGGGAAYGLQRSGLVERRLADLRTAKGEIRELRLDDGSQLTLNTGTAVDLHFGAQERRLHLLGGEIFVAMAQEPAAGQRPFVVETAEGRVQALGTRFAVRREAEVSRVAVYEGAVQLRPHGAAMDSRVAAGQQLSFDARQAGALQAADRNAVAWTRGLLVAERMRLDAFLGELGRYRPGVIRCDTTVAGQWVSGSYPLADTDRVLSALEHALPLRVRRYSRYWVVVEAA